MGKEEFIAKYVGEVPAPPTVREMIAENLRERQFLRQLLSLAESAAATARACHQIDQAEAEYHEAGFQSLLQSSRELAKKLEAIEREGSP